MFDWLYEFVDARQGIEDSYQDASDYWEDLDD